MQSEAPHISVVIPVYNEADTVEELYERLFGTLEEFGRAFEVVVVDDGSTDGTLDLLRRLHGADPRLRVLRLARNFGQSPALYAGFSVVRGEYVVMLDADLQNFPEDIPKPVEKLDEGYDMVSGYRADRQDSLFRYAASRLLNLWVSRITRQSLHDYGCSLKAFRRELVERMNALTHRNRYLPVDAAWLGGRVAEVPVRHAERSRGESKYGFFKLIGTALDLFTGITSLPLQFIGMLGWVFAAIGMLMGLRVAYVRLAYGDINQMSTVVAVFFFLAGLQMIATGMMCEYVSRIYTEVQRKPYYVIQEELE